MILIAFCPSFTFMKDISSLWSVRVPLSHFFLAYFLFLVSERPPLSLFSLLTSSLWSVRVFLLSLFSCLTSSLWSVSVPLSHFFLAYFLFLVSDVLLSHFFLAYSLSLVSERSPHFFLAYFPDALSRFGLIPLLIGLLSYPLI